MALPFPSPGKNSLRTPSRSPQPCGAAQSAARLSG